MTSFEAMRALVPYTNRINEWIGNSPDWWERYWQIVRSVAQGGMTPQQAVDHHIPPSNKTEVPAQA